MFRTSKISPEHRHAVRDLYLEGYTLQECGTHFGVSREAIHYIMRKFFPEVKRRLAGPGHKRPEKLCRRQIDTRGEFEIVSQEPLGKDICLVQTETEELAIPTPILAYIAGIFDGEGCVNFTKSGKYKALVIRASIVNTNLEVLEYIKSIFVNGIIIRTDHRRFPHWKPSFRLDYSNRHAVRFVEAIEPWLIIKADQAVIPTMWEFLRDERSKDQGVLDAYKLIERQLTWLNKKGSGDRGPEPMVEVLREAGHATC